MVTMAVAYYLMARVLWGSKRIGESSPPQMELIRLKQKVVQMLLCGKLFDEVLFTKCCV